MKKLREGNALERVCAQQLSAEAENLLQNLAIDPELFTQSLSGQARHEAQAEMISLVQRAATLDVPEIELEMAKTAMARLAAYGTRAMHTDKAAGLETA